MSKEQTPITYKVLKVTNESPYGWLDLDSSEAEIITELINKEVNTKILEALESDLKDLSDCYKAHAKDNPRKEVCQVLHTLIMEKHEQIAQTKQK